MSTTIDQRVVEMQFNNAEFERNVSQTIDSVDKLKKSLDFGNTGSGLDALSDAANTVSLKFSALEVAAVTALGTITTQAVYAGEKLLKSLSIDQITAGYTKYEQKTASVQTLLNSTGKSIDTVNGYLDKLMWFSDETSYSFTDMTSALATMSASGGDIEKLIPMIEGVANATSFAGKGASEFSRVMYNLNQSYSQGYLTSLDWKSVVYAGVNSKQLVQTLIDAGVALGKIEEGQVTVENFASTLSDKWADTEVMETAFGKFSEMTEAAYELIEAGEYETATEAYAAIADQFDEVASKAAKSAQEAKSFTEAIDATKDAVSSKWLTMFETIFGNYEEAKELWTDLSEELYDVFASPLDSLNDKLSDALSSDFRITADGFQALIDTGVDGMPEFRKELVAAAEAAGIAFDGMDGSASAFLDSLDSGWLTVDLFTETLDNLQNGILSTGDNLFDLSESQLESIGYTREQVTALQKLATQAKKTTTPIGSLVSSMSKLSGRTNLIDAFWTAWDNVREILSTVKEAYRDVFPESTSESIYALTERIKEFAENLKLSETNLSKLRSTFRGIFSVIHIVYSAISALVTGFKNLISVFSPVVSGFLSVSSTVGSAVEKVDSFITSTNLFNKIVVAALSPVVIVFETLRYIVEDMAEAFNEAGGGIAGAASAIKTAWDDVLKIITAVIKTLTGIDISGLFGGFSVNLSGLLGSNSSSEAEKATKNVQSYMSAFVDFKRYGGGIIGTVAALNDVWGIFTESVRSAGGGVKGILSTIGGVFKSLATVIGSLISTIINFVSRLTGVGVPAILSKIQSAVNSLGGAVSTLFSGIGALFSSLTSGLHPLQAIRDVFAKIGEALSAIKIALGGSSAKLSFSGLFDTSFVDWLKTGGDILQTIVELVVELTGTVGGGLLKALRAVVNVFPSNSKYGFSEFFDTLLSGAMIYGIIKFVRSLHKTVEAVDTVKNSIAGMFGSIGKTFNSITGYVQQLTNKAKINNFKNVAVSIAILAGSVLVLALALKSLSKVDWDEMKVGMVGFLEIMVLLVAAVIAINKLGGISVTKFDSKGEYITQMLGIVKMVASMLVLSSAVKSMATALATLSTLDFKSMQVAMLGLAELMTMIGIFAKLTGGTNTLGLLGLLPVILMVKVIIKHLQELSAVDPSSITSGVKIMAIVFGAITASLTIIAAVSKGSRNVSGFGTGLGLIAAAGSLFVIAKALQRFAELDASAMLDSALIMGGMLLVITAFMALLSLMGRSTVKKYDGNGLSFLSMFQGGSMMDVGGGMLLTATSLVVLAKAMKTLMDVVTNSTGKEMLEALGVFAICMGSIAAVAKILSPLTGSLSKMGLALLSIGAGLVLISAGSPLIASAMNTLTQYAPLIVESLMTFLIELLDGIAADMPRLVAAVMNFLGALFGSVIEELKKLDTGDLENLLLGLGVLTTALIGFKYLKSLVPGAMAGVAEIGLFVIEVVAVTALIIAAIGALVAGFGALAEIPYAQELVEKGVELLTTIGEAIGGIVGGLIGGMAEGITSALPQIASDLSNFMENLGPFLEGMDSDGSLLSKLSGFSEAMNQFSITENLGTCISDLSDAASDLTSLNSTFSSIEFSSVESILGTLEKAVTSFDSATGLDLNAVFVQIGESASSSFAFGLAQNEGAIIISSQNIMIDCVETVRSFLPAFGSAGEYLISGFVYGIQNGEASVVDAAGALAEAVDQKIREVLIVNSPSRKGIEIGMFVDLGLATGISDYQGTVVNAASTMAQSIETAVRDATQVHSLSPLYFGIGSWVSASTAAGITSEQYAAASAALDFGEETGTYVSTGLLNAMPAVYSSGKQVGEAAIEGIADGVEEESGSWFSKMMNGLARGTDSIFGGSYASDGLSRFTDTANDSILSIVEAVKNGGDVEEGVESLMDVIGLGITDNADTVTSAASAVGFSAISAIESEVKLSRGELGEYIVEGIADGISSDMSAEEAATQKAQNIISAFQEVLDKMDIRSEIADLELELWQAVNPDATVSEQETMQLNRYYDAIYGSNGKIEAATAAYAEYLAVAHELGEEDQTTLEYKQKYLQAVLDVNDAISTYNDYAAEEIENNKTAQESYDELLASWKTADSLTIKNSAGVITEVLRGQDEIQARWEYLEELARNATGYDPDAITELDQIDAATVLGEIVNAATNVYEQNADTIIASVLAVSSAYASETAGATSSMVNAMSAGSTVSGAAIGTTMANAISSGIQNGGSTVTSTVNSLLTSCTTTMNDDYSDWVQVGGYLVDGFIAGIRAKQAEAAAAAAAMAAAARSAASVEISVNSPSKDFADIGMYADLGMAQGLEDYTDTVTTASAAMAKSGLDGVTKVVSQINAMMDDEGAYAPTIAPVVDLTDVNRSARVIGGMFRDETLDVSANVRSAQYTGYLNDSVVNETSGNAASGGNSYTFNQNNYSPKSLSRIEIYRQTKNLFSTLKGGEHMIQSIAITNPSSETLTLPFDETMPNTGIVITNVSGLGPVAATVNTESIAGLDGSMYTGAYQRTRNIVFTLRLVETDDLTIEDCRLKVYQYFPVKGLVTISVVTNAYVSSFVRQLVTSGYVESVEPDIFSSRESVQVSVVCPDSYWFLQRAIGLSYFTGGYNYGTSYEDSSGSFTLTNLGDTAIGARLTITFKSAFEDGLYIENIENTTTGDVLHINSYSYDADAQLLISSIDKSSMWHDNKFAICYPDSNDSSNVVNMLGYLADISAWLTLAPGENSIEVYSETGNAIAGIQFSFLWYAACFGV